MHGCRLQLGFAISLGLFLGELNLYAKGNLVEQIGVDKCVFLLRKSLQNDPETNVRRYLTTHANLLDQLLAAEEAKALELLKKNILENGTVAAATSNQKPNYRYHWRRDAALVHKTMWVIEQHVEE